MEEGINSTPLLTMEISIIVSVVIPTYQRPHLLLKCLNALNGQSFNIKNFEVIVVSDGLDSTTEKKINQISKTSSLQLRYFSLPEKKGPAAARNMGWIQSRGALIAFTDDDCIPHDDWLKNIVNEYGNEPTIAYTGKVVVPLPKFPSDFERNMAGLEKADFVTANCICTKNALTTLGGFDERFEMAWREDSDFEFRLIENQIPIKKINNAVVIHPVRKAYWGVSLKEQKKGKFNALLYKKFPALYRSRIQEKPLWEYYFMILFLIGVVAGMYFNSEVTIVVCFCCWLFLLLSFIKKRLTNTSRSFKHILEMLVTSIAIPFVSVYWHWYGAYKYRVFYF